MRKVFFLIFLSTIILGACGGFSLGDGDTSSGGTGDPEDGTAQEETIVLDFWTFWGSEQRRPVIDQIIEDFNTSQDEIEVRHTYTPWGDIWTKNLAAIAAGDPPDVIINDIMTVKLRAEEGQIEPITEFVQDEVSGRFYDQMMDAAIHEDEIYALPFNTDTQILFYNKDLFEEVGLDPEQPPETWEELDEYAAQLDIEEEGTYERIGFYPLIGAGTDIWVLNALGENYLQDDGEVLIDTEPVHETFNWILDSQDKYGQNRITSVNSQFENAQQDPFMSGDVPMMVQNANYYVQLRDFAEDLNFGVAPLPERVPGNGNTSWGGGFVAEVPMGASNPEASYQFIEYLTSHEAQLYWAEQNFDLVAHEEAGVSAAGSGEFDDSGQEVYTQMIENMDETLLTPQPVIAPDYAGTVNPIFESIVSGNTDVESGLEQAQSELEQLVEDNR
ncbi:Multiple sugar transport system substrate-binding protein [Lacicoccus alkaliphilus]|uniref:Multiple sugar transport system substrate-binding protein n=1 Tax=Lacicoccus alkaliphilus DSM 16010 TaxID=1123231 RepID=A0A1M7E3V1_9BACL|nr:multiple sugar transport system substrate-binding protein [Salinicoccus alkaliphilus DSM 16010]